jgi:hypothetical protein
MEFFDGHNQQLPLKKNRREHAPADFKNKDTSIFKSPDSAPLQSPGMTVGKMFSYHPTLLMPDPARFRQRPLSLEFIEPGRSPSKYSWRDAPLSFNTTKRSNYKLRVEKTPELMLSALRVACRGHMMSENDRSPLLKGV